MSRKKVGDVGGHVTHEAPCEAADDGYDHDTKGDGPAQEKAPPFLAA